MRNEQAVDQCVFLGLQIAVPERAAGRRQEACGCRPRYMEACSVRACPQCSSEGSGSQLLQVRHIMSMVHCLLYQWKGGKHLSSANRFSMGLPRL